MSESDLILKVEKILLEEDILGLGDFESLPVRCFSDGSPESYFPVVGVMMGVDFQSLEMEAKIHLQIIGKKYIAERTPYLTTRVTLTDIKNRLFRLGFKREHYQAYSLRKLGTNTLEEFIGPCTRKFFGNFQNSAFRMQYAMAQPGWALSFHQDFSHFRRHGFRVIVPIDSVSLISFQIDGREDVYELIPGNAYFINIARLHRAFNPFDKERLAIMFQINSDEKILNGMLTHPLSETETLQKYENFLA
jgi:hypothetical protein